MRSLKGSTTALAALGAAAALIGACGEETEAPAQAPVPKLAPASAIEADPYAITCGHVHQPEWAHLTRQVTFAIADRERFRNLNRIFASQSLYYALTEVCKQKPVTFEPAQAAAEGVRDGRFRVRPPDHDVG